MADVQLEHGFVKIANALLEAIIYAPLTATQVKLVALLIRLTYGWRQVTVQISNKDLAEKANVAFTGGFRRALDELIREGVVIEVSASHGRTPAIYTVNKDFENWGRLSVPAKALERLFGDRPWSGGTDVRVPREGHTIVRRPSETVPPQGTEESPTGAQDAPHRGIVDAAKSAPAGDLTPPKDSSSTVEIQTTTTARTRLDAVRLVVAANKGLADHTDPRRRQNIPRILPTMGSTVEALERLDAAGVPQEFAESAIYEAARTHKGEGEIKSLLYFVDRTIRRYQEHTLAGTIATSKAPSGLPASRPPAELRRAAEARERRGEEQEARLERAYAAARQLAVDAWAKEHPHEYQAIRARVIEESGIDPDSNSFAKVSINIAIAAEVVHRFEVFPAIAAWLEQQKAAS